VLGRTVLSIGASHYRYDVDTVPSVMLDVAAAHRRDADASHGSASAACCAHRSWRAATRGIILMSNGVVAIWRICYTSRALCVPHSGSGPLAQENRALSVGMGQK
jgi:hypothetical protein